MDLVGYGFSPGILQCQGSLLYLRKPAEKGDDYKGLVGWIIKNNDTKAQL